MTRVISLGLMIIVLAAVTPSAAIATGNHVNRCEKGCYATFAGCVIQAIIGCFQQYGNKFHARNQCIQDEIDDFCKPDLNQCLADCRDTGTEEQP
jgi:hypothetical protein